ncbi:MAG: HAD family hydrolase [Nitrososphaerota archaeon]|nr:HAD family hydrolase [Nitrososphaerota archaeon]
MEVHVFIQRAKAYLNLIKLEYVLQRSTPNMEEGVDGLSKIKAVLFDFIGTLVNVKGYSLEVSKIKLYRAIVDAGFKVNQKDFLDAYAQAHEKYRVERYQKLVEVTNAVWISEALNNLGFETKPDDSRVKTAVNVFFEDYVDSFRLRKCAKKVLRMLSESYKLGLVSNFTYAPVIYAGLRKVGIDSFFNVVLVSDAVGWRKPHMKIFEEALKRLEVKAEETLYVGDSPDEDIKGAKGLGMKTVFVASQFFSLKKLLESGQQPDAIARNLCEAERKIQELIALS